MPELVPHSTPSPLDLTRSTEATRRELYDQVLRIQSVPDADADDDEEPAPPFDPEAAGLTVFYILGRWFATWTDLEAPAEAPEDRRQELVRIQTAETPDGILLFEV
jgi:hypothetical protein